MASIKLVVGILFLCCFLRGFSCVESADEQDTLSGPGVNVCVRKRSQVKYSLTTKLFFEPVYKPILQPCSNWSSRVCSSYSTTYTKKFRKVRTSKLETITMYTCCPGWTRIRGSNNCEIATCTRPCKNNGKCTGPNSCTCAEGWTGSDCSKGEYRYVCPLNL
ncbi:epidermal growth factor-like protein 8 [Actinia tenebrosa]|uniref:Epidermal growth factor-like protein 8 n=1 Tax=Actinia tenebrosa TaxID=6105 RepID=A0A6P8HUV3_ACTTE|nr:epidermal growth factor-like protein 8 [Actinia tenebrosa]